MSILDKAIHLSWKYIDKPTNTKGHRHFSFIALGNKILSTGWNNGNKTHPLAYRFNHRYFRIHAEVDAIRKFPLPPKFFKDCIMINTRISGGGKIAMARPCDKCMNVLTVFGIRTIAYTGNEGVWRWISM